MYLKTDLVNQELANPSPTYPGRTSPLLIGGVSQLQNVMKTKSFDWISLSCSKPYADALCAQTMEMKDINSHYKDCFHKGYNAHEYRGVLGGLCQRHTQPYSKHKRWGKSGELWVWTGGNASGCNFESMPSLGVHERKCTRIDIAFDLQCGKDTASTEIMEGFRKHFEEKGLTCGIRGHGDKRGYTSYIGAQSGSRMVRIYRKDIESKNWHYGSTMRIELVLKEDHAQNLFRIACENEETAFNIASAHIKDITGATLFDDLKSVPDTEQKKPSDLASSLASMVLQYGSLLEIIKINNIDLGELLNTRLLSVSDRTKYRELKRIKDASEANMPQVMLEASRIIRKRI